MENPGEALYNMARKLYEKKEYRQAFYYINDALIEEPGNPGIKQMFDKISEHYRQELLGMKFEDYQSLQAILRNTKKAIEAGKPQEANDYLSFIKKQFKVIINFSFYPDKEEILFYNGGALTEAEDFTFFSVKSNREIFQELGTEDHNSTIINL